MIYKLYVANIKCGGCAHSITKKLESISNISNIHVEPQDRSVSFESNDVTAVSIVKSSLSKMGYPEGEATTFQTAKSYINCAIGKVGKNL